MEAKGASRLANDLFGVLTLSLLYLTALLTGQGEHLRNSLGLLFALVLPGYALLAGIDSNWRERDVSERLTLSCVLSLATVIAVAMGLNVVRRLDPVWLAGALEAIIVAGCVRDYRRRTGVSLDAGGHLDWLPSQRESRSTLAIVVDLVTICCVCSTLFLVADLIQFERVPVPTTALYLLGDDRKAGGYVKSVACGSRFRVTVGVINNEVIVKDYSIRMQMDDQPSRILTRITLGPGDIWEGPVEVRPDRCGTLQSVAFHLLEGESESPERSVYQRVRVTVGDQSEG